MAALPPTPAQAPPGSLPSRSAEQTPELQRVLRLVRDRKEVAEKLQKQYRERWDTYYGLYRNYRKLKSAVAGAQSDRDRDDVINQGKREWGAELFVPYAFTIVETIVPRALSDDPTMTVPPLQPGQDGADAAARVKNLLEQQQRDIDYELKLQAVARSGFKYGLGVQKTYWEKEVRKVVRNVPGTVPQRLLGRTNSGLVAVQQEIVVREGPQVEPVDIWDFFWDPTAYSIETADWVIHRTWRTYDYIVQKVQSGQWFPIDLNALKGQGTQNRAQIWSGRNEAAGLDQPASPQGGQGKLFEVWEYHDGTNVHTVLNGELVVSSAITPFYHRELPFQIFRPTPQEHEFVGIGEIEPITHLQYELNSLRSMRMDNANLVINKAFIYAQGYVDPDDLRVGPGQGIPVDGADIKSVLEPLDIGDLPASSYREEQALKDDIERAAGVDDASAGAGGAVGSTATGIQLVQAALNVRTALKTKNLERETIRPAARQFHELNQQHTLAPRPVRVPQPDGGFSFDQVTPQDLASVGYPEPDAGSTQPDNPAARQTAAQGVYTMLSTNPRVDQAKLGLYILKEFDVPDAESLITPANTVPVDPQVLGEELVKQGLPQDQVLQALDAGLAAGTGQAPPPTDTTPQDNQAQNQPQQQPTPPPQGQ